VPTTSYVLRKELNAAVGQGEIDAAIDCAGAEEMIRLGFGLLSTAGHYARSAWSAIASTSRCSRLSRASTPTTARSGGTTTTSARSSRWPSREDRPHGQGDPLRRRQRERGSVASGRHRGARGHQVLTTRGSITACARRSTMRSTPTSWRHVESRGRRHATASVLGNWLMDVLSESVGRPVADRTRLLPFGAGHLPPHATSHIACRVAFALARGVIIVFSGGGGW
jgi:hypothetical protein